MACVKICSILIGPNLITAIGIFCKILNKKNTSEMVSWLLIIFPICNERPAYHYKEKT